MICCSCFIFLDLGLIDVVSLVLIMVVWVFISLRCLVVTCVVGVLFVVFLGLLIAL